MYIGDWLSQCRVTGLRSVTPNSSKSDTNQVPYEATAAIALYSVYVEDLETIGCFLDLQLMGVFQIIKM